VLNEMQFINYTLLNMRTIRASKTMSITSNFTLDSKCGNMAIIRHILMPVVYWHAALDVAALFLCIFYSG